MAIEQCTNAAMTYCCYGEGYPQDKGCNAYANTCPIALTASDVAITITEGETLVWILTFASRFIGTSVISVSAGPRFQVETETVEISSSEWNEEFTVKVTSINNSAVAPSDVSGMIQLTIANPDDSRYDGITFKRNVSIVEDDVVGITMNSEIFVLKEDSAEEKNLILSLTSAPFNDVNITLADSNAQLEYSTDSITFTSTNWNEEQTVVLNAIDDDVSEDETHYTTINLSMTSDDDAYALFSPTAIEVRVIDKAATVDESPAPVFDYVIQSEFENSLIITFTEYNSTMTGLPEGVTLENCHTLNIFDTASTALLGGIFDCTWTSPRELFIAYSESHQITIGSTLTLRGGEIRSTSTSIVYSSGTLPITLRTQAAVATSAIVSDLGSEVIIYFKGLLNMKMFSGKVACTQVFSNARKQLGIGALCQLNTNSKSLTAELKQSGALEFLDEVDEDNLCPSENSLTFIEGVITPLEGSIESVTGCIAVVMPENPVTPVVSLTAPNMVGSCEELKLIGQTSGSGSRPWESLEWSVKSETAEETMIASVQQYLEMASQQRKTIVMIPQKIITGRTSDVYEFTLQVTNFANMTSSDSAIVTKSDKALPTIETKQQTSFTMGRNEDKTISVSAVPPQCGPGTDKLTYKWTLDSGVLVGDSSIDIFKTSSPNSIKLLGAMLKPLENYVFTVTVSMTIPNTTDTVVNSESFGVEMVLSDLDVPAEMSLRFGSTSDIYLSSPVVDPDEINTPFSIDWSCSLYNQTDSTSSDCLTSGDDVLAINDFITMTGDDAADPTGSSLLIPAGTLPVVADSHYLMTMSVSKGVRSVDVEYDVVIVSGTIPSVEFTSFSPTVSGGVPLATQNKFIVGATAISDDPSSLEYSWELIGDVDLEDVASGSLSREKIIFKENSLTPGSVYILRCLVTDSNGSNMVGFNFETNSPPAGGYVENEGMGDGEEFTTTFTFSTSGWNDEHTPLEFKFSAVNMQTGDETVVQSYSTLSYCEVTLSRGDYYIKVGVRDAYGAMSESAIDALGKSVVVRVLGMKIPDGQNRASYVMEQQYSLLEEARNSGDPSQVFSVSRSMMSSFKDVCAGVICIHGTCDEDTGSCVCDEGYSDSSCSELTVDGGLSESWSEWSACSLSCGSGTQTATRECDNPTPMYGGAECSASDMIKEQTCNEEDCTETIDGGFTEWVAGECVADCSDLPFGGDVTGEMTYTRTCTNPAPSPDGKSCAWLGAFEKVESCSYTCDSSIPPKQCLNSKYDSSTKTFLIECNGQGTCMRTKRGEEVTQSECLENDFFCQTACVCNDDYSGRGCDKSADDLAELKENSKTCLQDIYDVSSQVSSDDLSDSAETLASIASDADILDSETATMVSEIIRNMLTGSGVASLDSDTSTNLLDSADSVLSQMLDSGADISDGVETVNTIANSLLLGMESGEDAQTVEGDNMVMVMQVRDPDHLSDPMSISDSYGEEKVSLILPDGLIDDLTRRRRLTTAPTAVQLKSVQWNDNPNGVGQTDSELSSLVTSVDLHDQDGNTIDVSGLTKPIEFSFTVDHTNVDQVECTYYDVDNDVWSSRGMAVVGLEIGDESMHVTCATIHLTDLAAKTGSASPELNVVDPIGDASLLLAYNWSNATPIYVLGGITLIFSSFCFFAGMSQKKQKKQLIELQKAQFLKYGEMAPTITKRKDSALQRVVDGFRSQHSWGSFLVAPLKDQVAMSRIQRLVVVVSVTYTAIAVNAAFYGKKSISFEQEIITVICAMLACLPAATLFPFMFRKVNSYRSRTIKARVEGQKRMKFMNRFKKKKKTTAKKGQVAPSSVAAIVNPVKSTENKELLNSSMKKGDLIATPGAMAFSDSPPINKSSAATPSKSGNKYMPRPGMASLVGNNTGPYTKAYILQYKVMYLLAIFIIFAISAVGVILGLMKYSDKDFSKEVFLIEAAVFGLLAVTSIFGFWGYKKKNKGHVEMFSVILLLFFILLATGITWIVLTKDVNLMKLSAQAIMEKSWDDYYNESATVTESYEILANYQTENSCCGFLDTSDNVIGTCDTDLVTEGCYTYLIDDFQTMNSWFVICSGIIVILLLSAVHYARHVSKILESASIMALNSNPDASNKAALTLQAIYRGWQGRAKAVREREIEVWNHLHFHRSVMTSLVYFIVFFYCTFMLYVNLLYGIKFSDSITKSWLKASVVSILLDVIVQQPLIIVGRSVLAPAFVVIYEKVIGRLVKCFPSLF
eukprot:TRINITY_DN1256_c0_g1_i3.p1 TRINITY_DN1256_c0_g1~~TRINITY_DN1256_c0_g1_i3.p1  ORF type:complete len:2520 (+),score=841.96 TRINITY_DN1256_c0_g1_i3:901-7560(+)